MARRSVERTGMSVNLQNRQRKLFSIWRKIRPRRLRLSPAAVSSPLTKSYLRRVQRALEKSRPVLEGLSLVQFNELVNHDFFERPHLFPSHGPSFMLPGQRLSSELQREWNRVRDWAQNREKLDSLREFWKHPHAAAMPGLHVKLTLAVLKGVPREKVRSLLSHPDFDAEHHFPAGQFGTIRSSVRDRVLQGLRRSRT